MYKDPVVRDRINSFALVTYIPQPLAGFLDRLRQELVPNCFLRAHATILPPRPITPAPQAVWPMICELAPVFDPFEIELTGVEVFPVSDVIYINIATGSEELKRMHDAMNVDGLKFHEAFAFHPHVTLAQELKPDEVDELTRIARIRWAEYPGSRRFLVERIVFVQNTRRNEWVDLGECLLGAGNSC